MRNGIPAFLASIAVKTGFLAKKAIGNLCYINLMAESGEKQAFSTLSTQFYYSTD
ncbi:MAG: hypothetical protein R3E91_05435 [Chlamydiales bacterium]